MQISAGNLSVGTISVVWVATHCMWLGWMQSSAGNVAVKQMLSLAGAEAALKQPGRAAAAAAESM